jgi:hypothetical protein
MLAEEARCGKGLAAGHELASKYVNPSGKGRFYAQKIGIRG